MKVKINIEERLVKSYELDVDAKSRYEAIMIAMDFILKKYNDEEIVLDADDFDGNLLVDANCDGIVIKNHPNTPIFRGDHREKVKSFKEVK